MTKRTPCDCRFNGFHGCQGELWFGADAQSLWDLIALLRTKGFRIGIGEAHDSPNQYEDMILVPARSGVPTEDAAHRGFLVAPPDDRARDALRAAVVELGIEGYRSQMGLPCPHKPASSHELA